MTFWYLDHTHGQLTELRETLNNYFRDQGLHVLRDDSPEPIQNNLTDGDFLIVHTFYPQVWIDWSRDQNVILLLVSRDPEQLRNILEGNNNDYPNCNYHDQSVRNGEFDQNNFTELLDLMLGRPNQ